jgi:hypothetical protein
MKGIIGGTVADYVSSTFLDCPGEIVFECYILATEAQLL